MLFLNIVWKDFCIFVKEGQQSLTQHAVSFKIQLTFCNKLNRRGGEKEGPWEIEIWWNAL